MPRKSLTPAFVNAAKADPGAERTVFWDTALPGFGLVVTAGGAKTLVVQYRAGGRGSPSRRMKIGREGEAITVTDARKRARDILAEAAKGNDPLEQRRAAVRAETDTLEAVTAEYLKRKRHLRSIGETGKVFHRHVLPELGKRPIGSISRKDVVRLLDKIEDGSGDRTADLVLGILRALLNWHASRDDEFRSPIVRGMARTKPKERARSRILTDDELRAVWRAGEAAGYPFGSLVRFILLTAARRNEAARMGQSERNGDVWLIPADRSKNRREMALPLSAAALSLLDSLPVVGKKGYVFTLSGAVPFRSFTAGKAAFDVLVLAELEKIGADRGDAALLAFVAEVRTLIQQAANPDQAVHGPARTQLRARWWTLHDLRRSARSLLSRAGVDPDHAERVLGHLIPGIRSVYDRHEFAEEKRRAVEMLATQIMAIVNAEPGKVILMRAAKA